jgi:hypothetical protein
MARTKQIIILANSRKPDGRCVAGKESNGGAWVRPISDRPGGSVSEEERHYQDGVDPRLLDIVDVPFVRHQPSPTQSENWLIDPAWYWDRVGEYPRSELDLLVDDIDDLWVNGYSTVAGRNDRVPESAALAIDESLRFIHVAKLTIRVLAPGEMFGDAKRKVRGAFTLGGEAYDFTVTDPNIEKPFLAGTNGDYDVGEQYLTISLAEPHKGFGYKLIAAAIRPAE